MTDRELMQQALEALEYPGPSWPETRQSIAAALRERLAQPEQEPVAHVYLFDPNGKPRVAWDNAKSIKIGTKLYTAPQRPEWIGLTATEVHETEGYEEDRKLYRFARAIEAKLRGKNA